MRNILCAFFVLFALASCKKDNSDLIINDPTDGVTVLSTYASALSSPGKLSLLDKRGITLWERSTAVAPVNFKRWVVNNRVRYTYMEFDVNTKQLTPGILPTTGVILDENFNEIKRVRLLPYNGRTSALAIDAHDFIYLDDNHYIVLAYVQKTVNNIPASLKPVDNCTVVAPIIQEIQNDQVVWEWDGTNFPELYTTSVEGNAFSNGNIVHDYVHMNSIYLDPTDNSLICSMRNLNQIIKISRPGGQIVWRLGGTNSDFPITADMKFLRQHDATLTDNNQTLLLLDNGEATERSYSRVMEFRLNQDAKSISSYKAYNLPDNIFAQFMGSVQKRGDTYFVGCGSTPKILEVNYVTNKVNFMMTLPEVSYRAIKE